MSLNQTKYNFGSFGPHFADHPIDQFPLIHFQHMQLGHPYEVKIEKLGEHMCFILWWPRLLKNNTSSCLGEIPPSPSSLVCRHQDAASLTSTGAFLTILVHHITILQCHTMMNHQHFARFTSCPLPESLFTLHQPSCNSSYREEWQQPVATSVLAHGDLQNNCRPVREGHRQSHLLGLLGPSLIAHLFPSNKIAVSAQTATSLTYPSYLRNLDLQSGHWDTRMYPLGLHWLTNYGTARPISEGNLPRLLIPLI